MAARGIVVKKPLENRGCLHNSLHGSKLHYCMNLGPGGLHCGLLHRHHRLSAGGQKRHPFVPAHVKCG